jgi:hybrid cluster-associated redox disulfide protein
MTAVTKNSVIGDILDENRETSRFFLSMGMHCLGCPASRGETIEQACSVHGVDADKLVENINDFLANSR